MAANDIGIDLGTATVIVCDSSQKILLREPSVVAVNTTTNKVLAVGNEASQMLGKTPSNIQAMMPLADGVISDFDMTSEMLRYFIKKVYKSSIVRPRVAICVPSGVTEVESRAVVNAAVAAGARKVFLIEEPVAAALGAGIDISRPNGNMIVDIGGGTSDVAVISFNGIVRKTSVKIAGNKFDQAIVRLIRNRYGVLVGDRMAERIKIAVGSVYYEEGENPSFEAKGRSLTTGLPQKFTITREDVCPTLVETIIPILRAMRSILEITPPELSADIHENGLLLTGGGAMLHGLPEIITAETRIPARLAENPTDCVAIGTAKSFSLVGQIFEGFLTPATR